MDYVPFADYLGSGSKWLSDFAGVVQAEHLAATSSVTGDLSMVASNLWSHNPDMDMSIMSAASVSIGSSAADADVRIQPEGTGHVIVDHSLLLLGTSIHATDTAGLLVD